MRACARRGPVRLASEPGVTQHLRVHPQNPQRRLIFRAVEELQAGGVIVYPTDSAYALGCRLGDREALERIRRLRRLPETHHFTLACRDLREIATYARVSNPAFRLLRAHTPGPYTFILPGTKQVPRRLMHPKQRTIGLRVPENPIARALLEQLDEPLMTTTLILPEQALPLSDPDEIARRLAGTVDVLLDGGPGGLEPTTMVDLTDDVPVMLRRGVGDPAPFE
jgi:tRNA threonylcarbamoyl adenosine modification protein (Sua5/YciO/YrdC/YwlC family)